MLVCAPPSTYLEVRRQCVGFNCSLLIPCDSWGLNLVIRLSGEHHDSLSHHLRPLLAFQSAKK